MIGEQLYRQYIHNVHTRCVICTRAHTAAVHVVLRAVCSLLSYLCYRVIHTKHLLTNNKHMHSKNNSCVAKKGIMQQYLFMLETVFRRRLLLNNDDIEPLCALLLS
jgi:hypothetical protein